MSQHATIPSAEVIHQNAIEHGWYEGVTIENMGPDFIPSKLALVHSELSEALEAYRGHGIPERGNYALPGEDSFQEELADAVIRIFDLCGFLALDIEIAINLKHEYNKSRPYRHGNKTV